MRVRATWMVFTALDGALLDVKTMAFEAARASLRRLRTDGVPVVPVTGRTFAEVRPLADALGIEDPVVIESGGGIARRAGSAWRMEGCGAGTKPLREAIPVIERRTGARLRLYSAMRLDEAAALSGLTGVDLRRSLQRNFDEPFVLDRGSLADVEEAARSLGLLVRTGVKFHHLSGPARKGAAAQRVRDEIAAACGVKPFVVALGYAPIDGEFLSIADVPILMPRRNGTPDPLLVAMFPEARIASAAGPVGWATTIDEISDSLTSRAGSA
jgi:mannosyl-3-phosphoglycerate phosphatase